MTDGKSQHRRNLIHRACLFLALLGIIAVSIYLSRPDFAPLDEAQAAGRDEASLPHAGEDYFSGMDNGMQLTGDEVQGRNMWLVWTGGNDRFWDRVTRNSLATFDLLKIVTSNPAQTYCNGQPCSRDNRWNWLGAINEPCFSKAVGPDPKHFGLWLDVRDATCPPDPFADETSYPGVRIGARGTRFSDGTELPVGSYYGEPTGILGLRLFPNPDFDQLARDKWDPQRYYTDPSYYKDPNLVRPYRVGMACGFCHVGPSPINPPADPENPGWSNLNSTVGSQYLWMDRVFVYGADKGNFLYQLMSSFPTGTMDTSLVSTDSIDNPRTMNAIYLLGDRLGEIHFWGKETLQGGELDNRQLAGTFDAPDTSWSPRVLKDASDSVGVLGALNRVYLNIGLYSEEWTRHFNPFFGGKPITPIEIAVAEKNSTYWRATEMGTTAMAHFLVAAGQPDKLAQAPGGAARLTTDAAVLDHGKQVFADTCARCHSSKLPDKARAMMPDGCAGPGYLQCWKTYWSYSQTDEFKIAMRALVAAPDFLDHNYLSSEARIPVTLLRTNICSPLATNALKGNIWDNFSSSTYKALPSVGKVTVQGPFDAKAWQYTMPAGGRGYTRVPSLIALWSTAPFLLNNQLGQTYGDPSVEGRLKVFDEAIRQLLWPEMRLMDKGFKGHIVRTSARSFVEIPKVAIPAWVNSALKLAPDDLLKSVTSSDGEIRVGPIPQGFPINLAANFQPPSDLKTWAERKAQLELIKTLADRFLAMRGSFDPAADDAEQLKWLAQFGPEMLALSKCPDFVVNRGHYFGTAEFNETAGLSDDEKAFGTEPVLSDDDKTALIEFLKTF